MHVVRLLLYRFLLFFFKQKTAYEMRISDWSSDVCSSDLLMLLQTDAADGHDDLACIGIRSIGDLQIEFAIVLEQIAAAQRERREQREDECLAHGSSSLIEQAQYVGTSARSWAGGSEERRVGKEGVSTCRSRWTP